MGPEAKGGARPGSRLRAGVRPACRYRTGLLTALLLAATAAAVAFVDFDSEDPGMGTNTTRVPPQFVDGEPIRGNKRPVLEVLADLPRRSAERRPIVWIGNSHQHALNDVEPGDTVSSVYLHRRLNGDKYPGHLPAIGISYANLTYEEQLLLTLGLARLHPERRPALVIHGVRFHDAREMGVRQELRPLLKHAAVRRWVEEPSVEEAQYEDALSRLRRDLRAAEVEARKEEGFEAWLVRNVGPHLPIFHRRRFLYARIRLGLYQFRNWLFQIETTSKRPILESRYRQSMQFLDLALHVAKRNGIEVLLYNVPLRQAVQTPYVKPEYERFRKELRLMAERRGARFADYDALIPAELWGTWYDTEFPDFSHFTAEGHRMLARAVLRDIMPMLDGLPTARAHLQEIEDGDALQ